MLPFVINVIFYSFWQYALLWFFAPQYLVIPSFQSVASRWMDAGLPPFLPSPQEEWWCSPLPFSLFPLVCANAAWKEEEETARKQQCRKDQHISKWLHKNIGACFYTYMTVRMLFILSKTAIELQEQQEAARSRWRERSINQTRSGLPPFLLVPYF